MMILNPEIISTFEKFTFRPSSHKLDQNGLGPPEKKKGKNKTPFTNIKIVIMFSQELIYVSH